MENRTATIETATEASSRVRRAQIVANLKRKYGGDLAANFVVNKDLLGGQIRVGSDVWDGSVRNRLHRLQQQSFNLYLL